MSNTTLKKSWIPRTTNIEQIKYKIEKVKNKDDKKYKKKYYKKNIQKGQNYENITYIR